MSSLASWGILLGWLMASIVIGLLVGRAIDLMGEDDD